MGDRVPGPWRWPRGAGAPAAAGEWVLRAVKARARDAARDGGSPCARPADPPHRPGPARDLQRREGSTRPWAPGRWACLPGPLPRPPRGQRPAPHLPSAHVRRAVPTHAGCLSAAPTVRPGGLRPRRLLGGGEQASVQPVPRPHSVHSRTVHRPRCRLCSGNSDTLCSGAPGEGGVTGRPESLPSPAALPCGEGASFPSPSHVTQTRRSPASRAAQARIQLLGSREPTPSSPIICPLPTSAAAAAEPGGNVTVRRLPPGAHAKPRSVSPPPPSCLSDRKSVV